MNEINIREMDKSETPQLIQWLYAHRETNGVDLTPFRNNQVRVFVATDETGILCFIPVQAVFIYDALAPRPNLAPFRLARVFQEMNAHLVNEAKKKNVGKILVQPSDAKFSQFLQDELGYKHPARETLQLKIEKHKQESAKA